MRLTRVFAIGIIASSLALTAYSSLQAQSLRTAGPPAEFPPASFKGKQYVDSRGCVYIRAGVDGNVTWVPRVTRSRKIVCGYKPSLPPGSGTTPSAPRQTAGVEQITLPPADRPKSTDATAARPAPSSTQTAAAAPRRAATPKPSRTTTPARPTAQAPAAVAPAPAPVRVPAPAISAAQSTVRPPSPGPEPTVWSNPDPKPKAPRTAAAAPRPILLPPTGTGRAPSPGPEPTVFNATPAPAATAATTPRPAAPAPRRVPGPAPTQTGCPNASEFSNQYVNKNGRFAVRCGPQALPPVNHRVIGDGASLAPATAPDLAPAPVASPPVLAENTRVVPRHVYDNRRNTTNVTLAEGYERVDLGDDRLNPHRAERTLAPARRTGSVTLPKGYRIAWDDGRLNPRRGIGQPSGEAQMAQIWTDTVPRRLVRVPTDKPVVQIPKTEKPGLPRTRTKARAASKTTTANTAKATKPRYIRVGAYGSEAEARKAAQALARKTKLPVRLGTAKRGGQTYRVVMAGPFSGDQATRAIARVRGAGYASARLTK